MRRTFFKTLQWGSGNYWLPRARRNALYILMFHQVNDQDRSYYQAVPTSVFDKLCQFVSAHFVSLHISEVDQHFQDSSRPAVAITFDDGHYDFVENALPLLKRYGLKATLNIDTEILQTGRPQDNVRIYDILNQTKKSSYRHEKYLPEAIELDVPNKFRIEQRFSKLLSSLDASERRALSDHVNQKLGGDHIKFSKVISKEDLKILSNSGIEIGSHTHTHAILTHLPTKTLELELTKSKQILEAICEKDIELLAYPNGIWNTTVQKTARECGYKYLLETADKINFPKISRQRSYTRINIYQRSYEESLSQLFGVQSLMRRATSHLTGMVRT